MNLIKYIQGLKKGKDVHKIELESMKDPFLTEALEGYEMVDGNHAEQIAKMQERIAIKSKKKRSFIIWVAAACLLPLIIGVGLHSWIAEDIKKSQPAIAMLKEEKINYAIVEESEKIVQQDVTECQLPTIQKAKDEVRSRAAGTPRQVKSASTSSKKATEPKIEKVQKIKVISQSQITSDNLIIPDTNIEITHDLVAVTEPMSMEIHEEQEGTPVFEKPHMQKENEENRQSLEKIKSKRKIKQLKASDVSIASVDKKEVQRAEPIVGEKEFKKYISQRMVVPQDSCANVKGVIVLKFTISSNGRPTNIEVVQGLCGGLEKEAIRLLNEGPIWMGDDIPGYVSIKF
ncbi:MAG: energy transducer TonB [Prevotellaceae bacterium]|nr:energy transducer TonB [Prevotellaceae bacterium]